MLWKVVVVLLLLLLLLLLLSLLLLLLLLRILFNRMGPIYTLHPLVSRTSTTRQNF